MQMVGQLFVEPERNGFGTARAGYLLLCDRAYECCAASAARWAAEVFPGRCGLEFRSGSSRMHSSVHRRPCCDSSGHLVVGRTKQIPWKMLAPGYKFDCGGPIHRLEKDDTASFTAIDTLNA